MAEEKKSIARPSAQEISKIPVGSLGLIPLKGCEEFTEQIDSYLVKWRSERQSEHKENLLFAGYEKPSYIIQADCPRFGSGEGKGLIRSSVRGDDLYFIVDVTNYSILYTVGGVQNHYSPDDHFQDLKRLIQAASGKAMHGFTKNYIRVELPPSPDNDRLDNQLVRVRLGGFNHNKTALKAIF